MSRASLNPKRGTYVLTPAELPPEESNGDSSSRPPGARVTQGQWIVTQEAFDKLLAAFSADRNEAAIQYERIHVKLIRFFEWHPCDSPDVRADQTLNRVARKIEEGQPIDNLIGYIYGVARLIFMEARKELDRTTELSDLAD